MKLTAHPVQDIDMPIVPAARSREWMDALPERYANRCLPLRIANESGWWILNSHAFDVTWQGGQHQSALKLDYIDQEKPYPASSSFGAGILTFSIPYLFTTPPGYNLLFRGPANMPKRGASPLEGIVETDWSPYTATMNWQITAVDEPVHFARGEPICQVVPQMRGELESFATQMKPIESDAELHSEYEAWALGRTTFNKNLLRGDPEAKRQGWQKDYFQGKRLEEHQTKLKLAEFIKE